MGVGTTMEILSLGLSSLLVTNNSRRWATMMALVVVEGAGYVAYPFVTSSWSLVVPEMMIRTSVAVCGSLLGSMVATIVDIRAITDQGIGFCVYGASLSTGLIAGTFLSGSLVNTVTFRTLFIVIGSVTMVSSLVVSVFRRVNPVVQLDLGRPPASLSLLEVSDPPVKRASVDHDDDQDLQL